MPRPVRISLANKCQLLFGAAVILILTAALSVAWGRMRDLVHKGQEEQARQLANSWLANAIQLDAAFSLTDEPDVMEMPEQNPGLLMDLVEDQDFAGRRTEDPFFKQAIERFEDRPNSVDLFRPVVDKMGNKYYRYARAIRKREWEARLGRNPLMHPSQFTPTLDTTSVANPVLAVLLINLRADEAQRQLALNGIYIIGAGLLAGLLAIGVFWFITTRLVLSPVRVLRGTAEKVAEGDFNIRSDINTGDEFEQLSDMFNHMLEKIRRDQERLRDVNKGMDLKLDELARSNIALYEANKIKGEFLANVSHELRTPLNSIVGFAEILQETLADRTGPVDEKRKRYAANIITSSRSLLDLITDLLDLAKIDAGRMELRVGEVNLCDTAEGLVMLIRPQAEKKQIDLRVQLEPALPLIRTDAGKLHQIVFNFLSNAVKFTPPGGAVTLAVAAERPSSGDSGGSGADADGRARHVRISVTDTGPGIPPEDHERVFDKFTQLDPVVTREHGGTGLGLTISRQLADLLRGRIELESDTGRGATFSLILPTTLEARTVPLMPDLAQSPPPPRPVTAER